ncbi:MAG: hypothetical protein KME29_14750 [Calothrix sp. FI2-JRJ7]|jgi:hypothetical protein|nr:hypothetical protein [Calothrix sp. FI2-JRJ7]
MQHNSKFLKILTLSLLVGGISTACNFKISTANLDNVKICSELANDKKCTSDTAEFNGNTSKIFVTADLNYAPEGTKVKINWNYLGGKAGAGATIDTLNLETKDNANNITSHLTANKRGFPAGKYEVVMTLDTDNSKPIRKEFTVAQN